MSSRPPFDQHELAVRCKVWLAFSELYLDSEVHYPNIAGALARSPYSLETLRDILRNEVHPVVCFNLLSAAGEWAGFDERVLSARIEQRLSRPVWLRWLHVYPAMHGFVREQWHKLEPLLIAARTSE
jgi:hypothetical protein